MKIDPKWPKNRPHVTALAAHFQAPAALSNGDSETITAVSLPPAVLSGVTPKDQKRYLEAIRQQKAPELIQESVDLSEALQTATAASKLTELIFDENYNADEQSAIDRAERATAEAEAALTQSIRDN